MQSQIANFDFDFEDGNTNRATHNWLQLTVAAISHNLDPEPWLYRDVVFGSVYARILAPGVGYLRRVIERYPRDWGPYRITWFIVAHFDFLNDPENDVVEMEQ